MPSGITHILLKKELHDYPLSDPLDEVLAAGMDFLQIGAVAPDLPYASVADDDFFLTTQSDLADNFHYVKTNEVPLTMLQLLKDRQAALAPRELDFSFCFVSGYIAHVVADGIVHPYIRDKVGNYSDHKTEHRKLEMQLDILYMHRLSEKTGYSLELSCSNLEDELKNFNRKTYPEIDKAIEIFQNAIHSVYNKTYQSDTILGWVEGLHRMFKVATSHIPIIYKIGVDSAFFFDIFDHVDKYKDLLVLSKPVDAQPLNFLKKESIRYFDDVLPQFFKKYLPLAEKAYDFIYEGGSALTPEDIMPIDLDTGRPLASHNNLDIVPSFWS